MSLKPVFLYKIVNDGREFNYSGVGEDYVDDDGVTWERTYIVCDEPALKVDAARSDLNVTLACDDPVALLHSPFPAIGDTEIYVCKFWLGVTEPALWWSGRVLRCAFEGDSAKLECRNTLAALDIEGLPETNQNLCNYFLFDGRCPVVAANYRLPVGIGSVAGATVTVTGITQPTGWFKGGTFQASNGDWRFIIAHSGNTLTLESAFPASTLATGDAADIYPGCDRTRTTCVAKYGDDTGGGDAFGGNPIVPTVNPHELGRYI